MTSRYTIIGYYPDNDQLYTATFEGDSVDVAINKCKHSIEACIRMVAVIRGQATVCDDFDTVEYLDPPDEEWKDGQFVVQVGAKIYGPHDYKEAQSQAHLLDGLIVKLSRIPEESEQCN